MEMSGELHASAALFRQGTSVPIKWECELAPEPVRMFWRNEKSLALTGTPTPEFPARSLVTMLTALSRFPKYYVYFDVAIALREDKRIYVLFHSRQP
jgi:hypothetical protein